MERSFVVIVVAHDLCTTRNESLDDFEVVSPACNVNGGIEFVSNCIDVCPLRNEKFNNFSIILIARDVEWCLIKGMTNKQNKKCEMLLMRNKYGGIEERKKKFMRNAKKREGRERKVNVHCVDIKAFLDEFFDKLDA